MTDGPIELGADDPYPETVKLIEDLVEMKKKRGAMDPLEYHDKCMGMIIDAMNKARDPSPAEVKIKIVEIPGVVTSDKPEESFGKPTPEGKAKPERWFCKIEFTFNVDTEPSKERYEGDAPIDFARRAFEEGLRPRLSNAFSGDDGISWYLSTYKDGIVARREA